MSPLEAFSRTFVFVSSEDEVFVSTFAYCGTKCESDSVATKKKKINDNGFFFTSFFNSYQ